LFFCKPPVTFLFVFTQEAQLFNKEELKVYVYPPSLLVGPGGWGFGAWGQGSGVKPQPPAQNPRPRRRSFHFLFIFFMKSLISIEKQNYLFFNSKINEYEISKKFKFFRNFIFKN